MATDLAPLITANGERWRKAKLTRATSFRSVALRLVANKVRYQVVETTTGVPWFIVAVIHEREASGDFSKSIAQGDPWNAVSIHVPKGRGPFSSFLDAAKDALVNCPPYAAKWTDWSAGGSLTLLELYNGLGYDLYHHMASPYLWAGTDQYVKGKYVTDGTFNADAVDQQLGCAGLLMKMQELDASVRFTDDPPVVVPLTPKPVTTPQPAPVQPRAPVVVPTPPVIPATPDAPAPKPEQPRPAPSPPSRGWVSALLTALLSALKTIFNRSKT